VKASTNIMVKALPGKKTLDLETFKAAAGVVDQQQRDAFAAVSADTTVADLKTGQQSIKVR
jgi:hypothetical protein